MLDLDLYVLSLKNQRNLGGEVYSTPYRFDEGPFSEKGFGLKWVSLEGTFHTKGGL